MKALIQRVSEAAVVVDGVTIGEIKQGLLLLLAVEKNDTEANGVKLAHKVLNYRIFPDAEGKMNLSLKDMGGQLLVVSQFTLAADTRKGLRPSFTPAAAPEHARQLYGFYVAECRKTLGHVATGEFGADMKVSLCNDGPVTFMLEVN